MERQHQYVACADGYTMLIEQTGVEETVRLRWVFESVEDLGSDGEYFKDTGCKE